MTVIEAINKIDAMKPNNYTKADKTAWLSALDGVIKKEITDTHEGAEKVNFGGYTEDTPPDTELTVPAPYDEIYLRWLEAQIDYSNGEYGKYANSRLMYNAAYSAFERWYNRNNVPLKKGFKYF